MPYQEAAVLVDILLQAVATVACSASTARNSSTGSESHSCAMCVGNARQALKILCNAANESGIGSKGWALFLNLYVFHLPHHCAG